MKKGDKQSDGKGKLLFGVAQKQIKIHDLSKVDTAFLNAYHDPKYKDAILGLLREVE